MPETDHLSRLSVTELLQTHAAVIDELRRRRVVRSKNNPVGDYTEWLVSNKLDLQLVAKSTAGYDAIDDNLVRYQIKGRRVTPGNKSRQLSAIRNLANRDFDFLIAVLFDENFHLLAAAKIPHNVVGEYAKYRSHTNAHILHLQESVLADERVEGLIALLDG